MLILALCPRIKGFGRLAQPGHAHSFSRCRISAAARGVSFKADTFHVANRPLKERTRSCFISGSRNSPCRRQEPGSEAIITGAVVAAASEIIDTLSWVTMIR